MKIIALTKYGSQGASSRVRFEQYIKRFEKSQIDVIVTPLINNEMLKFKYLNGKYAFWPIVKAYIKRILVMKTIHKYDLVWIEKEALPWMPLWFERLLLEGSKYVLDFDDATFHDYDQHRLKIVRVLYKNRIDELMKRSVLVVAGNSYLAKRAKNSGAKNVYIIPTVIDIDRYQILANKKNHYSDNLPSIVWIGSPSTSKYIYLIEDSLRILSKKYKYVLKIIGASSIEIEGVNVEIINWSEDTEINNIMTSDIGIMPLNDSCWEQGKCGYKIIQYMACGLPSVASAVGANLEIINSSAVGFLARNQKDWETALERLLQNHELRLSIGSKARERVEQNYCIQKTESDMKKLLISASKELI